MFDAETAFNYDAPIAPSDREVVEDCTQDFDFIDYSSMGKESLKDVVPPLPVAEDINVRRVFPNNQNTGLNLLKSMRPTNKIVTVERPVDKSYDFSISESDGHCDFATDSVNTERNAPKCSSTSTMFTNKELSGAAFGPCFTVCKTHLMGAGHARNNEIVLKDNKLTRYVYDSMHRHKSSTNEEATQTSDDRKLIDELFEVDLKEANDERDSLRSENKLLAEELKSLKSANYTYSQRIKDFDQELSIEKELREFLKKENEEKDQANQKLTDEYFRLQKQVEELREEKKEMDNEVEEVKQDNIKFKLSNLDKSDTDSSMIEELKRSTRYLTKQSSIKDKKIKTLQVSVTSISEALRQQTKTVCELSRKSNNDVTPEEEGKHKVYVGFESLVKITCNVLGSLQKENEQKIEEPEAMKKLCKMVSGDENLFTLFRKIFSKEGEEGEDEDTEGVEKRVLFLINLMSYFYSGADESPSSSGLKTLL